MNKGSRATTNRDPVRPASNGYRMPAEWERHEATWMAWPHNRTDWPGKLQAVRWVYAEMVGKLSAGERVRLLVNTKKHEEIARRLLARAGVDLGAVEFFRVPTNRAWTRDYGPLFVRKVSRPRGTAIVRFRFTGWARYPDWQTDNQVPVRVARRLGLPLLKLEPGPGLVLEGGSIDVNGRGSLLATEECLLDQQTQPRNPGRTRQELEALLHRYLGARHVLWLGRGIAGDDTHGHVDDICRFVRPGTVVLAREGNPRDVNYRPLAENRERLQGLRLENGRKLEVVPLPMPEPVYFSGHRLPASYANFYIGNRTVLVPTFNDPRDRVALGLLSELFPGRTVVGIHARDLVWGLGAIHCLTQQQPAGE